MKLSSGNIAKTKFFNIQKPYLEKIGLTPERFSAINAIENEHNQFKSKLSIFSRYLLLFLNLIVIGFFSNKLKLLC